MMRLLLGIGSIGLYLTLGGSLAADEAIAPWERDFEEVWVKVDEQFHDPDFGGLDWDAVRRRYRPLIRAAANAEEGAGLINRMLAELETSHTRFFTADDVPYYVLFDLFSGSAIDAAKAKRFPDSRVSYSGIGLFTVANDDGVFAKGVIHGGPAEAAGVRVGDRLVSVDGRPWHPIRGFRGKAGKPVSLVVQRTADEASTTVLEVVPREIVPGEFYLEAMRTSARVIDTPEGKVGYVRIWSYAGQQYQDLLEELVQFGALATADALVIDLRDGWGGAGPSNLRLFSKRIPVISSVRRDGSVIDYDSQWRRPVALLINDGSRSGKEVVAYGFRKYDYGPLVGRRTAGAVTAGRGIPIGDRALLYLAVAGVLIDGERLEGVGVEPTIDVPFAIPYAGGTDPQLARAIDALLSPTER